MEAGDVIDLMNDVEKVLANVTKNKVPLTLYHPLRQNRKRP